MKIATRPEIAHKANELKTNLNRLHSELQAFKQNTQTPQSPIARRAEGAY